VGEIGPNEFQKFVPIFVKKKHPSGKFQAKSVRARPHWLKERAERKKG